ncbi:MAG: hypothetical protein JST54_35275 [Deltaproteobacteria bacterium]|nr:hypothetical protein [Deltaproteobacteria bacterium]
MTRAVLALALIFSGRVAFADEPDPPATTRAIVLGASAGASLLPAFDAYPTRGDPQFALRLGSRFASGVTSTLTYENLGLHPHEGATPWQLVAAEVRYTFFHRTPEPFAEAVVGFSILNSDEILAPGAGPREWDLTYGLGGGMDMRLFDSVAIELVGHAMSTSALGQRLFVFTAGLGVEVDIIPP